MPGVRETFLKLCRREDLTRDEAREIFLHIMSGQAPDAQIGGLLVGLAAKGTTVEELVGAATVMREKIIPVDCDAAEIVLDTCGTGGDIRHTFNISTAAALIAAGAGVKVVKHGNRAASGRAGAADVLEKLGLKLETSPENLRRCLERANICFAFARAHHPAMKFVAEARKALGIPTIFNLLGPLTNPGRARHQLLGVFAPELTDRLATVLRELGSARAWVVHAEDGMDEISTLGPTRISELREKHIRSWTLDPKDVGIEYARLSDLQVESIDAAAEALTGVLRKKTGPMRDIALLNGAGALVVAEKAKDLKEGLALARESVDSGKARVALEMLIEASKA
ncbi:MAG: anthranilate phosphoribosyltransferase [Tepidisphaeraceae bacterium]